VCAYELHLSGLVFCTIWLISLAAPGLGMVGRLLFWRRPVRESVLDRPAVRSLVSSGVWVVAGQQLASGLDLLIISGILGSAQAGQYGLLWRVTQVVVVPVIGAGPLVTRAAEVARTDRTDAARTRSRRLLVALAGLELLCVAALCLANGPVFALLGNGEVHLPGLLLVSGVSWCCLEVVRRLAMSLTSTPEDMKVWRRLSVITAVPNVVLSVAFTYWIGVAGPLIASVLGQALLIGFAFPRIKLNARLAVLA
jgi:hypothetical protein